MYGGGGGLERIRLLFCGARDGFQNVWIDSGHTVAGTWSRVGMGKSLMQEPFQESGIRFSKAGILCSLESCPEAEFKEKHGVWDPMPELTVTSAYVDYHGHPYARVDLNPTPKICTLLALLGVRGLGEWYRRWIWIWCMHLGDPDQASCSSSISCTPTLYTHKTYEYSW